MAREVQGIRWADWGIHPFHESTNMRFALFRNETSTNKTSHTIKDVLGGITYGGKKSQLCSSLWASCDSLRGGMDSSQYKDYILTLLFVKYVSDKFKGVAYGDIDVPEGGRFDDMLALIGNKNIGEEMDKIIARLAEANGLREVIDNAHFNDEDKLGKSREMVDKLGELLSIFRDQMPDFNRNRADGDDIIGDTYEYLMRNFATESGKSKGQFYTPAEVSRVLAKVVGIEQVRLFFTNAEYEKLIKVMNDLGIAGSPDIVLIDARDNKPSASNVKGEA